METSKELSLKNEKNSTIKIALIKLLKIRLGVVVLPFVLLFIFYFLRNTLYI